MDTMKLAGELAVLERVEQQFDELVEQLVENQRRVAKSRIMEQPGATPSSVAEQMETLERALEKIEHNLRSQYDEFFAAQVSLRAERLSTEELEHHVDLLQDERVRGYLTRTRALERESRDLRNELVARLMRSALDCSS